MGKCKSLGVIELILPIVLAGKSLLRGDSPDEIARIISRLQYADWSAVWQQGRGSAAWNASITDLVRILIRLRELAEARIIAQMAETADDRQSNPESGSDASIVASPNLSEILTDGLGYIEQAEQIILAATDYFASLDAALDQMKPGNHQVRRQAYEDIARAYIPRGAALETNSLDTLEAIIEFDIELLEILHSDIRHDSAYLKELKAAFDALRTKASVVEDHIRRLDSASNVIRRLDSSSVGLRATLSHSRHLMQSIRDFARILGGWAAIDIDLVE